MTDKDSTKDTTDDSKRGLGSFLRTLLDSIADAHEEGRTHGRGEGRTPSGRGRIGYEFSIGLGTIDGDMEDETRDNRSRSRSRESQETNDYATSVHETNGEIIVVTDLPGVDPETLSAGVDSQSATLAIAADRDIIERVSLPHGTLTVADASFNNGVLELHLTEEP